MRFNNTTIPIIYLNSRVNGSARYDCSNYYIHMRAHAQTQTRVCCVCGCIEVRKGIRSEDSATMVLMHVYPLSIKIPLRVG